MDDFGGKLRQARERRGISLRQACARSTVPVLAIGGMSDARVAEVRAAGAAGFAAVGLFMRLTALPEVV